MSEAAFRRVAGDLLRQGYHVRFRARGNSMYPAIRDGEVLTCAPVEPGSIRPGDVLLFARGERVIAHRVTAIEGAGGTLRLWVKGDAAGEEEAVSADQVLGRVVAVERRGFRFWLKRFQARLWSKVRP